MPPCQSCSVQGKHNKCFRGKTYSARFAKTSKKTPRLVPLRKKAQSLPFSVSFDSRTTLSASEASREVAVYRAGRGAGRWGDMDRQQEAVAYRGGGAIRRVSAALAVAALRLFPLSREELKEARELQANYK